MEIINICSDVDSLFEGKISRIQTNQQIMASIRLLMKMTSNFRDVFAAAS